MKILRIFFLSIILSLNAMGQAPLWEKKSVNDLVNFELPLNAQYTAWQFIKTYSGQLNSNYYTVQYFDTVFFPITTERQFEIFLQGAVSGKSSDTAFKGYSALIVDTIIGNTSGLFARYISTDSSTYFKELCYYVTVANNHCYWFYSYSPYVDKEKQGVNFFFSSIHFEAEKIKERNFKLSKIYLKKDKL